MRFPSVWLPTLLFVFDQQLWRYRGPLTNLQT
uniref:Uncharacterized protein n=1 Tax=Podoviridae sp. ctsNK10 TaxID=2826582 RepID=A0A8S5NME4_9CAUD|nr:MAG TPA: hypothetical protein [Podoviridae sp. ctsNK10]